MVPLFIRTKQQFKKKQSFGAKKDQTKWNSPNSLVIGRKDETKREKFQYSNVIQSTQPKRKRKD